MGSHSKQNGKNLCRKCDKKYQRLLQDVAGKDYQTGKTEGTFRHDMTHAKDKNQSLEEITICHRSFLLSLIRKDFLPVYNTNYVC